MHDRLLRCALDLHVVHHGSADSERLRNFENAWHLCGVVGGSTPTAAQVLDEASGGTSSEKKLLHNVTSGAHFAVPHLSTVVITPVIHCCMGGWRSMVSALEAFVRRPNEVEDQCLGRVGLSAGRNGDC